jgi:hypothetical protein
LKSGVSRLLHFEGQTGGHACILRGAAYGGTRDNGVTMKTARPLGTLCSRAPFAQEGVQSGGETGGCAGRRAA